MLSELWHQRIGHPGPVRLSVLAQHNTGLNYKLTYDLHIMHSYQVYNYGKIKRAPLGQTSDTIKLVPGTRFHLDFGFIRALSMDVGVTAGHHIMNSYDGNNNYLFIVHAKYQHTWVLCQTSKAPPIHILKLFLEINGLKEGIQ
jgi:hypothetical protein